MLAGAIALAGAALLLRPWADSVMTVKVTVATDEAPPRVVYRTRRLFSSSSADLPLIRADVDLSRWAGKLIRFDVEGNVRLRWVGENSAGFVACETELAGPAGTHPIEFISWQQGHEIGMHTARLGPVAFRLDPTGKDRFAFATTGSLWHCLKAPASARLRFRLKPVLTSALGGSLEPYVASRRDRRVEEWMGEEARTAVRLLDSSTPRKAPPPDVFIYVIDALRADHLGCYGYTRGTSPAIDAFAAEATLYQNAQTAVTWTRPSVATMLTGLYPSVHGAMHRSDGLAQWPVLLPEMLQKAGYHTLSFVTNLNLSVPFGFDQGYDEFAYIDRAPAEFLVAMASRRLSAQSANRPVFMYLHTMEPHHPYLPRAETYRRFDRKIPGTWDGSVAWFDRLTPLHPKLSKADLDCLLDLYDAKVYEADEGFAEFLTALRKAGRYDDSLVILTADHGEAFTEHDTMIHGWDLNQETMQVPLIIHFPRGQYAGVRVRERATLADLAPTVLAQLGLKPDLPYRLSGLDLAQLAARPQAGPLRRIWGEVALLDSNDVDLVTVIDEDGLKRVADVSVPPRETAAKKTLGLWDTRADPEEKADLSDKLPVRASYDEQLIAGWLLEQHGWRERLAGAPAPKAKLSDELRRKLKGLGYLRGGGGLAAGEGK